jgi:hypothetical protein
MAKRTRDAIETTSMDRNAHDEGVDVMDGALVHLLSQEDAKNVFLMLVGRLRTTRKHSDGSNLEEWMELLQDVLAGVGQYPAFVG